MGAKRLFFKKDRDCWEYGYISVHIWTGTNFIRAFKQHHNAGAFDYSSITGQKELLNSFHSGEVNFCAEQSIIFAQATGLISKIITGNDYALRTHLYTFAKRSFNRFNTLKEFEEYYLHYSRGLLVEVKKEFEKGPRVGGKAESLLGLDLLKRLTRLI